MFLPRSTSLLCRDWALAIENFATCFTLLTLLSICYQYRAYKLVYRRYAGLFFTICCDTTDNEVLRNDRFQLTILMSSLLQLSLLEAIHFFVELLDQYFGNVCELDLVFNFHKVRFPGHSRGFPRHDVSYAGSRCRGRIYFSR